MDASKKESFTDPNIQYSIKALAKGMYVSLTNQNELIANKNNANSDREKFRILKNFDGTYSLKSVHNSKYVCAEVNAISNLKANRDWINDWEKFYIEKNNDNSFSFKAYENGKYISAAFNKITTGPFQKDQFSYDYRKPSPLIASSFGVGDCERFIILQEKQKINLLEPKRIIEPMEKMLNIFSN